MPLKSRSREADREWSIQKFKTMTSTLLSSHILNKTDQKAAEAALAALHHTTVPVSQTQQLSIAVIGARSTGKSTLTALLAGLPFLRFSPSQCSSFVMTHYIPPRSCTALRLIVQDVHYEDNAMLLTNGLVFTVSCLNVDLSIRHLESVVDRVLQYQEVLIAFTKTDQATNDEFTAALSRTTSIVARLRARRISCQIVMLSLPSDDTKAYLKTFVNHVYVSMRHALAQRELKELEEQLADSTASLLSENSVSLAAMINRRCIHSSLSSEVLSVAFNIEFFGNKGYAQQLELYKSIMAQQEPSSIKLPSNNTNKGSVTVTVMPAAPEDQSQTHSRSALEPYEEDGSKITENNISTSASTVVDDPL
ncbi:Hypothetical protein GSB_15186 [Giardia duodenalis]|uniref:Uncharacterized protein n=2 Tax=Giardia intestinalis TaxID=5741 RepID=V6TUJ9_GIAIN|nr:Hypothetical protein GSB_15186 [Giardia intestinalis]